MTLLSRGSITRFFKKEPPLPWKPPFGGGCVHSEILPHPTDPSKWTTRRCEAAASVRYTHGFLCDAHYAALRPNHGSYLRETANRDFVVENILEVENAAILQADIEGRVISQTLRLEDRVEVLGYKGGEPVEQITKRWGVFTVLADRSDY